LPADPEESIPILAKVPFEGQLGCSEGAQMKTQMVKWGNSLAVRIPEPIVEEAKLKQAIRSRSKRLLKDTSNCAGQPRYLPLSQLISQITRENRYAEVSTGGEVGREVVEW
jgi:antitoxin MazE